MIRILLGAFILFILFSPVYAEIYKWTDDKGGVHFTEDPSTIPEKYRDKVKSRETEEDGMTIEQRGQEKERSEAEAAKRSEKNRTEYQNSVKEDDARIRERQLRDQADERRIITEQQEKAHRQKETQIENTPKYVRQDCPHCSTTGRVRCWICRYDPKQQGQFPCHACGGTGWTVCGYCNGKGYIMSRVR